MIKDPAAAARASDEAGTSTAVLILEDIRKNGRSQETGLGTFEFRDDGLYLDGQEYLTGDLEEDTGLRIDVYRGADLVDSVQFAYFADLDDDEIHPTAVYRE